MTHLIFIFHLSELNVEFTFNLRILIYDSFYREEREKRGAVLNNLNLFYEVFRR